MRAFILFCRLVVGSLFIVSGLIKANDPLGFSYKLEEYFAESALNLPGLEPYALALAVLASTAEVVLGFAVLFGGRLRLAALALFLLTVFFGWLTLYTATCDPHGTYAVMVDGVAQERSVTCVTDCGCFGDAMKGSMGRSLTPWESFYKDAILFVLIVPILIHAFRRKDSGWNSRLDDMVLLPVGLLLVAVWSWVFTWNGPVWFTLLGFLGYALIKRALSGPRAEWLTAGWVTAITLAFTAWCYWHLPMRDYRPYAVGKSISQQKKDAKPPVNRVYVSYKLIATGEVKEFDTAQPYPWDDPAYEAVPNSTRIVEVEPGIASQVQDFHLVDRDGYELTDDILNEPTPVLLVLCYNVRKAGTAHLADIAQLAQQAQQAGWYVYGMAANGWDDIEDFRHQHQLPFEFVQGDEKVIKTMVRANPGIVLLKQGTVVGIWHANDTPTFEQARRKAG
jgi:uncharacterized membrane protein YphA (DoxX/SURF4 family)